MADDIAVASTEDSPPHVHADGEVSEEESFAKMIAAFEKAGKISAKVREDSKMLVNPGESYIDVVETVEKMIFDAGAVPGFPCNISINDTAAHYTPEIGSEGLIGEKDIVKIDLGVSVDGCVGDTAYTIDLSGEQPKLLEAAEEALKAAIASVKPGVPVSEVGGAIEEQIRSRGFKPIENLTGHKIEPFALHAGVSIPNIKSGDSYELQEGDIFAIEPFATTGIGHVADSSQVEIFSVQAEGKLRMRSSRDLLNKLVQRYFTLPFAERWLVRDFNSRLMLSAALKELLNAGCLHPYPVLKEAGKGLVSQFEHTILVEHDGARILTSA